MDLYSRLFQPGLKIAIFSPGWKTGTTGGYEPGVKTLSPPVSDTLYALVFNILYICFSFAYSTLSCAHFLDTLTDSNNIALVQRLYMSSEMLSKN